jgi:hypothetical protein
MNQIQVIPPAIIQGAGFDYRSLDDPDLAAEVQATTRRIRSRLRTSYIDTGNDLLATKEKLGHGRFGAWLEAECIMSASSAEECMSAARFVNKYAITANLPPTILVALASPSADADVVKQVLGDAEAGNPTPSTAKVKEMLAEARAAQKKTKAPQKKSAAQIAKEQAAQERADRARKKKWDDIHAREAENEARVAEAAGKAARLLVTGLGAAATIELFTIMSHVSFDRVKRLLGDIGVVENYRFLPEQEIEVKFGHAGDA